MKLDLEICELQGTIVAAFGSAGFWQATFYTGSPIPASVLPGMPVSGQGIPIGAIVTAVSPSSPAPLAMTVVLTSPSHTLNNPFVVSSTSVTMHVFNRPSSSIQSVSINNKAFMLGPDRFVIRGVAVDAKGAEFLGYPDVLADEHFEPFFGALLPKIIALNVNCIRVYQVHPSHSHVLAMNALANAGIYVMVALATSEFSVKQMTGDYSYETYLHATQVLREFQTYNNTLCVSVGNEVEFPGQQAANIAIENPSWTSTQIVQATIALELNVALAMKSFAQDVKAFLRANNYRAIPVGCAMQDGPQSSWTKSNPEKNQVGIIGTDTIATYYASGDDGMDFIGINSYAYVPGGSPTSYDHLGAECSPLSVPVFLTESGGLKADTERDWAIVPAMYNDANVYLQLSGQVAFQLLEEGAGFGLYVTGQGSGGEISLTATPLGGAKKLQEQFVWAAKQSPPQVATSPTSTIATTIVNQIPPDPINWWHRSASIKVENYTLASNNVTGLVQVLQMGVMVGTIGPAQSSTTPTSQTIQVVPGVHLTIQAQPTTGNDWLEVCGVSASMVIAGITVKTDVQWGSPCKLD